MVCDLNPSFLRVPLRYPNRPYRPIGPIGPIGPDRPKFHDAKAKFVLKKKSADEDAEFMRHYKFPQVVKSLYDESCAVCSLNVKSDAGASLIDAAHIIPFASSHNDAPRNGLALCRNHHWGFDASVFSISDDYRLILPRKGQTLEDYVRAGDKLKLPQDVRLAPAVEALRWHRRNRLVRV